MAEEGKNKKSTPKAPASFSKGLFLDGVPSNQPEGTYRWALNAINESEDGDMGTIVNEVGNYACADLGDPRFAVIGSVYIKDNDFVLFLAPTDPTLEGQGKILRVTDCKTEVLVYSNCLDFRIHKQIQAIQRTRNGCEVNIYFTDNYNDIRHLNTASLEDYLKPGEKRGDGTDPSVWDCENMKLWPDYNIPCIKFESLQEGGDLPPGSYQVAVQYLDGDLNSTNWTTLTHPVPVYDDRVTNSELRIKGNSPGEKTAKSIRFRVTDIDDSFSYIRMAVVANIDGTGTNSGSAYLLDPLPLFSNEDKFIEVTTIRTEDEVVVPIDEIVIPRKIYQKAKTIAQIKNRLVLGNVSENEIKHDLFQKAAQDIQITYATTTVSAEDANKDSVQSGEYYFTYRTHMRDEIAALAVVWVFKDGSETFGYHIPGRKKNEGADGGALIQEGDYNNPIANNYVSAVKAEHNRAPALNGWDTSIIVSSTNYADTKDINTHHYLNNTIDGTGDIERWEVYNTAIRTQQYTDTAAGSYVTKGEMAYYECRSDRYPDSRDCKGLPVYPYSKRNPATSILDPITAVEQDSIDNAWEQMHNGTGNGFYFQPVTNLKLAAFTMDKVRHHKFPDTTLEPHQYGDRNITNGKIDEFYNIPSYVYEASGPKTVSMGFEATNVKPPEEYAHLVQGFKIVQAKQEIKDKTVIDKGIAYYNHFAFKMFHGKNLPSGPFFGACTWMQQGNYFNKHISSFACAHGGHRDVNIAGFGDTPEVSLFGGGDDGQTSIAGHSVYDITFGSGSLFGSGNPISSGFVASYGIGGGVGNTVGEAESCLNCTNESKKKSALTHMLVQNNQWDKWFKGRDPLITVGLGLGTLPSALYALSRPRVASDWFEFGNGYPSAAWGWGRPAHPNDSCPDGDQSPEGINIGYDTDIIVYPNASMSYHGPLSKFGTIEGVDYIKVERVLIGYTWNIVCNTACCHNDGIEGAHRQSTDTYVGLGLTGQTNEYDSSDIPSNYDLHNDNTGGSGIGNPINGRDDNGTTYIYSRASYQHSVVPYSNINDGVRTMYDMGATPDPAGIVSTAEGNGPKPRDAWNSTTYPIYGYPLSNIRVDDFVKVEAFEKVFLETFGDAPFDNNTAMECMPISFKSKEYSDREQEWFRVPYPGNNPGFNNHFTVAGNTVNNEWGATNQFQCPLDSSFSLSTCDRLEDNVSGEFCESDDGTNKRGRITAYYVSLKKNAYNAYGNVSSLVYLPTHTCVIKVQQNNPYKSINTGPLFGGNSFVSRFAFKHTQFNARCARRVVKAEDAESGGAKSDCTERKRFWSQMGDSYGNPNVLYASAPLYLPPHPNKTVYEDVQGRHQKRHGIFNHISWYWTESYINTELRLGTQEPGKWFYPYHFEGGASYGALSFVDEPGYFRSGSQEGPTFLNEDTESEGEDAQTFKMNPDYNAYNNSNIYSAIPIQYDFCSECKETHPYRIAYSEQSFQEEQKDNYKYFLTNNYRDIPAHRGVVWNMFQYRNSLFVNTEESLWRVEPARNLLNTDTSTVYIGTGDFFSEEIQELVEGDTGFLGSQSQWAVLINAMGVSWPDVRHKKIFNLEKSPKDLSAMGIKNWSQKNMELGIYNQYQEIYDAPFPLIDNPANPAGAGYIAAYDGRHNRMVFTKRDYLLRAPFDTTDTSSAYYQALKIGEDSGSWELHGAGEDCQCIEDAELKAASPSTYVVTAETDDEGNTVCAHTYTITEGRPIGVDDDIYFFYGMQGMTWETAESINAQALTWIEEQRAVGGVLELWEGKDFHVPLGITTEKAWLEYMKLAMGTTTSLADIVAVPGGSSFIMKDPAYYGEVWGTYVSPGALAVVLQNDASVRYHDGTSVPNTVPTAEYTADFDSFVLKHAFYTSANRRFEALIYPVPETTTGLTQANKQFIQHLFAAVNGPETLSSAIHPVTLQPDEAGNSAQVGVPAGEIIDLTAATVSTGYTDAGLRSYGVSAVYDKRSSTDFTTGAFLNEIQEFISTLGNKLMSTDYKVITKCKYNLLGNSQTCISCIDEDVEVTIPLQLRRLHHDDTPIPTWTGKMSDIFECKSWTVSYSMMAGSWVAWHSYMPNYYVSSKDFFLSGMNQVLPERAQLTTWKHAIAPKHDNYQSFYGCIHPHAIDMATGLGPSAVTIAENLQFMTDASMYNVDTEQYVDSRYITHDSGYLYNSYQITDYLNFVVKDTDIQNMAVTSITENYNSCILDRKERTWKMNGFRDLAIDRHIASPPSLFTSAWSDISGSYYTDKVINPNAVSQTKDWFEQARMRDKYLGIRLFFSNLASPGKHRLVTNFLYGINQISPR